MRNDVARSSRVIDDTISNRRRNLFLNRELITWNINLPPHSPLMKRRERERRALRARRSRDDLLFLSKKKKLLEIKLRIDKFLEKGFETDGRIGNIAKKLGIYETKFRNRGVIRNRNRIVFRSITVH